LTTAASTTPSTKADDRIAGDGNLSPATNIDHALSLGDKLASGFTSQSIDIFGTLLGVLQGTRLPSSPDDSAPTSPTAEGPGSAPGGKGR